MGEYFTVAPLFATSNIVVVSFWKYFFRRDDDILATFWRHGSDYNYDRDVRIQWLLFDMDSHIA